MFPFNAFRPTFEAYDRLLSIQRRNYVHKCVYIEVYRRGVVTTEEYGTDMPTRHNSPIYERDSRSSVDAALGITLRSAGTLMVFRQWEGQKEQASRRRTPMAS